MQLHFGLLPIIARGNNLEQITENAIKKITKILNLKKGDKIIVTGGFPFRKVKYTNFMEIIEV